MITAAQLFQCEMRWQQPFMSLGIADLYARIVHKRDLLYGVVDAGGLPDPLLEHVEVLLREFKLMEAYCSWYGREGMPWE